MLNNLRSLPVSRSLGVAGIILAILVLLGFQKATAATIEEIVEQFFPERLIVESDEDFLKGGPRSFEASDFVLADLDGVGTRNYIVAAYTNGFSAAIRVLKRQGSTFVLVHEPSLGLMSGIFPGVELIDFDNDKRPEIVASFTSAKGHLMIWVFKWTGSELKVFGPSSIDGHGDVDTLLSDSDFIDLDGDGILEIIQPPETDTDTFVIYKFDGQKFALSGSPNYFGTFFRRTGAPTIVTREFRVNRTDIPYLLKILNGDKKGKQRVSSAIVRLNGEMIAGPSDFNQKMDQLVFPVRLQKENILEVEVRGQPGGRLIITVEPS